MVILFYYFTRQSCEIIFKSIILVQKGEMDKVLEGILVLLKTLFTKSSYSYLAMHNGLMKPSYTGIFYKRKHPMFCTLNVAQHKEL